MSTPSTIRIGTRSSRLAVWQAEYVAGLLQQHGWATELVFIETTGDKILHQALAKIGSKGLFTEELEEQLRTGDVHLAVHSAKDMPSTLPDDLEIIAFTERERVADVLVSFHTDLRLSADSQWRIGTSSVRRKAFFKHYYPHVQVSDVRGNLQTRIRKLEEGHFDALALAYAGVHRMGYDHLIVHHFPEEQFIPAAGQGSVAIEAHKNMAPDLKAALTQVLSHPPTATCLHAERAFLHTLQGGCSIPSFVLASLEENTLHIQGGLISLDGQHRLLCRRTGTADQALALGHQLATEVLEKGGKQMLRQIREEMSR